MINAIEYETSKGIVLKADKIITRRNAWHLKSIKGNGAPTATARGDSSYNSVGESYNGLKVEGREIELDLYADGYSAAGLQEMLKDVSKIATPSDEELGVLTLTNAAGERYRIQAKMLQLEQATEKRRSVLFSAVLTCPYVWFEDDTLQQVPIFAQTGGKEYPLDRPYTFVEITEQAGEHTLYLENKGDTKAPITIKLQGAGMTAATITNETNGASIIVEGAPNVAGIEICTDENDLRAEFADGSDASRYVSLFSELSELVLEPGINTVKVEMTATAATVAGCVIEWRGRYAACL